MENPTGTTHCVAMSHLQKIIAGKWKIIILWYLSTDTMRFGELQRHVGNITISTLTKQLRELEDDDFVYRNVYREVPPKVEYSLTEKGKSFIPILQSMKEWGEQHLI